MIGCGPPRIGCRLPRRRLRSTAARQSTPARVDVVVLHEIHVVQPEAVVLAAAAADGVLVPRRAGRVPSCAFVVFALVPATAIDESASSVVAIRGALQEISAPSARPTAA